MSVPLGRYAVSHGEPVSDLVADIIAYESGELDAIETVNLFQRLIDTDLAWTLQGSYGRQAVAFIQSGDCTHASGRRECNETEV